MAKSKGISVCAQISIVLALVAAVEVFLTGPLYKNHYDASIWLYQAKRFADTHYVASYLNHASEIEKTVNKGWHREQSFSEQYWWFSRIGHVTILGIVITIFGNSYVTIWLVTIIYGSLYVCALVMGIALALKMVKREKPHISDRQVMIAAGLSITAYVSSSIFAYMNGNLIAEVPAMTLVGASVLALWISIERRSALFATIAGIATCGLVIFRIEAIWNVFSFAIALFVADRAPGYKREVIRSHCYAVSAFSFGYVMYLLVFWPLSNPFLYVTYTSLFAGVKTGVPCGIGLFISGGCLVAVATSQIWTIGRSRLVGVAVIWLILASIPYWAQSFTSGICPIRVTSFVVFPWLLFAVAGLSVFLYDAKSMTKPNALAALGALVALLLISLSLTLDYSWKFIHTRPALWRAQMVRQALVVPQYESVTLLPLKRLHELAQEIYFKTSMANVIVYDSKKVYQGNLNMIRFFGPPYAQTDDLALQTDPTNARDCDPQSVTSAHSEPVYFCGRFTNSHAVDYAKRGWSARMLREDYVLTPAIPTQLNNVSTYDATPVVLGGFLEQHDIYRSMLGGASSGQHQPFDHSTPQLRMLGVRTGLKASEGEGLVSTLDR